MLKLNKKFLALVFAIALPIFSLSAALSALAAPGDTHTVCASGCDFSSIQAAIDAAAPGDTLNLAGETFTEPFTVDKSLIIQGSGAESTILQAAESQALAVSRVITVTEGVTVTISGVTVRYGKTLRDVHPAGSGGGILNQGTLTLAHSLVFSNTAENGGGGLYVDGDCIANIVDTTFSNNSTEGTGGGIKSYADSILSISNGTFLANTGGGIYYENAGGSNESDILLDISGSTFIGNQSGAVRTPSDGNSRVTGCTFQSNITPYSGGGISVGSFGHLTLSDSTFDSNQAGTNGGGISSSQYGDLVITNVTFKENIADFGAGVYNYNHGTISSSNVTFEGNIADINGGGFYNSYNSTATLTSTTFYSNSASSYGGGIYNYYGSRLDISNSTINGNTAGTSGAGIHNFQVATLNVTNVTIAGNSAELNGGGISNEFFSVLNLAGSVIAGSLLGGDCFNETGSEHGTVFDFGYNIVEDGSCIAASTSFAANPLLGPLQDNGGATLTHALLEGSPAMDAIPPAACAVTEDQRGMARPQGEGCDIGAFELEGEAAQLRIFLPIIVR